MPQVPSNLPKISIVTPSFNQGQFLEQTICSVLDQCYPNLEYIIMDGGSTDNSVEIIRKYEDRLAYWVSEPDKGQSHTINKGFQRSTGTILAWLNSDDLYLPEILLTVGKYFNTHPSVDLVYGEQIDIDSSGNVLRNVRLPRFSRLGLLVRGMFIPQPASFFCRRVYENLGGLEETLHWNMDYEYNLRMAFHNCRMEHIDQPLAMFRLHSSSKTVTGKLGNKEHWKEQELIQKKYLAQHPCHATGVLRFYFRAWRAFLNLDRILKFRHYYWILLHDWISTGQ